MGSKKFTSVFLAACMLFSVAMPQPAKAAADDAGEAEATVINVSEFEVAAEQQFDGYADDYAVVIQQMIEEAKKEEGPVILRFGENQTYDIYPDQAAQRELYVSNTVGTDQAYKDKKIGFLLEDMHDITIDGNGSKFLFHGKMTTFATIGCENIRFENYEFDFAVPTVVDITVESVNTSEKTAVVYVPECYNYQVSGTTVKWQGDVSPYTGTRYWETQGAMVYTQRHSFKTGLTWRGDTRSQSNPVFSNVSSIEDLGGHRLRFSYSSVSSEMEEGLCLQMRNTVRDHPGMFFWKSKDVVLKDLEVRFLHGFGIVGQSSENITLDHVIFEAPADTKRTTVGYADFIQMSGCKGKIHISNCSFANPHDDPINVHGTFMKVVGVDRDTKQVTLQFGHGETSGFPNYFEGDEVEFLVRSTLRSVETAEPITVEAVDGPDGMGGKGSLNDLNRIRLTLSDIPAEVATETYALEDVTYTPSVEITNNLFKETPTRGILVTTRKPVLIKDNVFDGMGMASIYISDDAHAKPGGGWWESGAVKDVTIEGNTFLRPTAGAAAIFIDPMNADSEVSWEKPVHQNITIRDNDFYMLNGQVLNVRSTEGLTFEDNRIYRYNPVELALEKLGTMREGEKASLTVDTKYKSLSSGLYSFSGCADVRISGNTYDGGLNLRANKSAMQEDGLIIEDESVAVGSDSKQPAELEGLALQYEVSDPEVLSVAEDGTLTALKEGTATVKAYLLIGGRQYDSNEVAVTVLEAVAPQNDTRLKKIMAPASARFDKSFDAEVLDYKAYCTEDTVRLGFEAMEENATMEVFFNGDVVKSGKGKLSDVGIPLASGKNQVYVRVSSERDTKAKVYSFALVKSQERYLSDMDWVSASNGWNDAHPVQKNKSVESKTLTMLNKDGQDQTFAKGLGVHADSRVVYDLTGLNAEYFSAYVGLDQEKKEESAGSVAFYIYGDDELLCGPVTIRRGDAMEQIMVSVAGVDELALVVDKVDDNSSDHADFGDAMIGIVEGTEAEAHQVIAQASPKAGGTVSSVVDGETNTTGFYTVTDGGSLTVTASEADGYQFKGWYGADGGQLGTSETYTLPAVTADQTVTAVFEPEKKEELAAGVEDVVSDSELDGFLPSVAEEYRKALEAAQKALRQTDADKEEIEAAINVLTAAKNALSEENKKGDSKKFADEITKAEAYDLSGYRQEGVDGYKAACEQAKRLLQRLLDGDETVSQGQINAALKAISDAKDKLQKETGGGYNTPEPPAVGTQIDDGVLIYTVTKSAAEGGEVSVKAVLDAAKKTVVIPDTVSKDGFSFVVTAVGDGAFSGNKKLSAITVGANVKQIGKNAFKKCTKLKKLTFKGAAAPSVKKKSFKGSKVKTVFVPKKMKAAQLKRLKNQLRAAGVKTNAYKKKK